MKRLAAACAAVCALCFTGCKTMQYYEENVNRDTPPAHISYPLGSADSTTSFTFSFEDIPVCIRIHYPWQERFFTPYEKIRCHEDCDLMTRMDFDVAGEKSARIESFKVTIALTDESGTVLQPVSENTGKFSLTHAYAKNQLPKKITAVYSAEFTLDGKAHSFSYSASLVQKGLSYAQVVFLNSLYM